MRAECCGLQAADGAGGGREGAAGVQVLRAVGVRVLRACRCCERGFKVVIDSLLTFFSIHFIHLICGCVCVVLFVKNGPEKHESV